MTKYNSIVDLPSSLVLTLACYKLGGAKNKIHSEEIFYQAFDWNKVKYSWSLKKFKNFPDAEGLRKGLFAARTAKLVNGAFARNLSKDGWTLTQLGIRFSRENDHLINSKSSKVILNQYEKKIIRDFKKNKLVKLIENSEINIYHLADLFDVPSGNNEFLRTKFNELLRLSEVDGDEESLKLLNKIKNLEKFKSFLDDKLYFNQQKAKYKKGN